MNIYLCKRPLPYNSWDEYAGHVIRAKNEDECKEMIGVFVDQYEITLIASGVVGEPGILLSDFNAG